MDDGQLELQGNRVEYRQRNGPGRSVVFVHGLASSSRMWTRELEALGGRFRCLALDLPGHGRSSNPPLQWYSLPNFVNVTHDLLHALHAGSACLVGHSLGGTIALDYTLQYPEEVWGLVLVNPVISGRVRHDLGWLDRRGPRRIIVDLTRRIWPRVSIGLQHVLALDRNHRIHQGHARRNLEDLTKVTADSFLGSAATATRSDLSTRLEEVRAPTLIVVGSGDRTVSPEEGRLAAAGIRGARLVELPTDHHPGDEAPEAFLQALQEFLDSTISH